MEVEAVEATGALNALAVAMRAAANTYFMIVICVLFVVMASDSGEEVVVVSVGD